MGGGGGEGCVVEGVSGNLLPNCIYTISTQWVIVF